MPLGGPLRGLRSSRRRRRVHFVPTSSPGLSPSWPTAPICSVADAAEEEDGDDVFVGGDGTVRDGLEEGVADPRHQGDRVAAAGTRPPIRAETQTTPPGYTGSLRLSGSSGGRGSRRAGGASERPGSAGASPPRDRTPSPRLWMRSAFDRHQADTLRRKVSRLAAISPQVKVFPRAPPGCAERGGPNYDDVRVLLGNPDKTTAGADRVMPRRTGPHRDKQRTTVGFARRGGVGFSGATRGSRHRCAIGPDIGGSRHLWHPPGPGAARRRGLASLSAGGSASFGDEAKVLSRS